MSTLTRTYARSQDQNPSGFNGTNVQHVPLLTPEGGEWREGKMSLPKRYAMAEQNTNDHLTGQRLFKEKLDVWIEWLETQGYTINSKTFERSDPVTPPQGRKVSVPNADRMHWVDDQEAEEMVWVFVRARFRRQTPLMMSTNDFYEIQRQAETYGVDFENDEKLPWNVIPADFGTKDVIDVEGGDDPMELAEKRRQSLGLKREDYLVEPLEERE